MIVQSVRTYRQQMPRIGSRKLYILVKREFGSQQGFPGRDKFLDLLSDQGLLLRIKRRKHYKTTDSNHPFKRYPNLIRDKVFRAPNQAWASDITYVETADGVCYLSLITDLYSRKIVGWALGETLQTVHCQRALEMALETLRYPEDSKGLIHHSDRGCQYCSYSYVDSLKSRGIQISMTESGDPLENAVAERVNGIIKSEWLYGVEIKDYADCYERVSQAIETYNNLRPHMSLDYQTPTEVHDFGAVPVRHWKTYSERKQANQEQTL